MADSTYSTIQGDTWDLILYKVFGAGAEKDMDKLLAVNPKHVKTVFFSADVVLQLPRIVTPFKEEPRPPWQK